MTDFAGQEKDGDFKKWGDDFEIGRGVDTLLRTMNNTDLA